MERSKKVQTLQQLAEGVDDASFQKFYGFFLGWGPLLALFGSYGFLVLLPRHLFDLPWARKAMTFLPKFWFEAREFKAKYPVEDIQFYFSASFIIYSLVGLIFLIAAVKCYRTGRRHPFTLTQSLPWRPFRHFALPGLAGIAFSVGVPMPVGWETTSSRGELFENPIRLPVFGLLGVGVLLLVGVVGALWLGRERARQEEERKRPPRRMISVSLDPPADR